MGLRLAISAFAVLLASFPAWSQPEGFGETEPVNTRKAETLEESFFTEPENPALKPEPVRVMIDPGHGGEDLGARSSKHILEKNVNLRIARAIMKMMSRNERVEVTLIRHDDRSMGWLERMEYANSGRGDLYIGVHAGGGGSPRSNPMRVYIHKSGEETRETGTGWDNLNSRYGGDNRKLAEAVAAGLQKFGDPGRGVRIIENGRLLLAGLAMPAVIVEPVDLSNPEDEIRLENEKYPEAIAGAIAPAIRNYIEKSGLLEKKAAAVRAVEPASPDAPADTTAVFSGGPM